ncbi:MAG TPA: lasso peptide biosynthesis PqqD family chaperone [Thermohalobaculum sp.]|nr:lasso peptide biosynthesis PqqD family chaperone [Thermohalobaculum sp.]
MTIGLETVVVRGSEHVEAEMGGQTVMMSIARGKYFALDGTARRIWELVAEPASVAEIVDRLVAEYEVDRERCTAEVMAFVRELLDNGLIVERRP